LLLNDNGLFFPNITEFTYVDSRANTYYYAPCRTPFNSACNSFSYSPDTAVCQKDDRKPTAQYHGLGSLSSTQWSPLSSGYGFVLSFPTGGEPDPPPMRQSNIAFVCDPNSPGLGAFSSAEENPVHTYDLIFKSPYACPVSGSNCSLTIGQWIAFWNSPDEPTTALEFYFFANGTATLYAIQADCMYTLPGTYAYDDVYDTLTWIPTYCHSSLRCSNCPLFYINQQPVTWGDCKTFDVTFGHGTENVTLKFRWVTSKLPK